MIPILLAFFAGLSDLISGLIPFYYKLEESDTRYIIGFAAGTMLGAVFFEMLPEIQPDKKKYRKRKLGERPFGNCKDIIKMGRS